MFAAVSARILHSSWYEGIQPSVTAIKRGSSLRNCGDTSMGKGGRVRVGELIIQIGHRKEFLTLTFRAKALRRFVPSSVSSFVPTKEQR